MICECRKSDALAGAPGEEAMVAPTSSLSPGPHLAKGLNKSLRSFGSSGHLQPPSSEVRICRISSGSQIWAVDLLSSLSSAMTSQISF